MSPEASPPTEEDRNPASALEMVQSEERERLQSALAYWLARFDELGESAFNDLATVDTPAIKFARTLTDENITDLLKLPVGILLDAVPKERGGDKELVVHDSGCMMSIAEIHQLLRDWPGQKTGTPDPKAATLLTAYLKAFADAAIDPEVSPVDDTDAARGLRAARELHDLVVRHQIATRNAKETGVSFSECLALHRAEGALSITPRPDSYQHGPLIDTERIDRESGGCRVSAVTLAINIDRNEKPFVPTTMDRRGYILETGVEKYFKALANKGISNTHVNKKPQKVADYNKNVESFRFEMLMQNLVATAGLDNIVSWYPATTQLFDDVFKLFGADEIVDEIEEIAGTDGPLSKEWWNKLGQVQKTKAHWLWMNIMMVELELSADLPNINAIMTSTTSRLRQLLLTHKIYPNDIDPTGNVYLIGTNSADVTRLPLLLQAQWFASRRQPITLLARGDRHRKEFRDAKIPPFSPFLSYLRFHTGDVLFVGIVLRLLRKLNILHTAATDAHADWGRRFLSAVSHSKWKPSLASRFKDALSFWISSVHHVGVSETRWRHFGLIDEYAADPSMPESLRLLALRRKHPMVKEDKHKLADMKVLTGYMREVLTVLIEAELMDVVDAGLSDLPINLLTDHEIVPYPDKKTHAPRLFRPIRIPESDWQIAWVKFQARPPLAKAHNFERLRLVYQRAADKAESE